MKRSTDRILTDGTRVRLHAYVMERLTGFEPVASSAERIAARMKR